MEKFKFPEDPKKDTPEGFNIKVPTYEPNQEKLDALLESVRSSTAEAAKAQKPIMDKKEMGMLDAVRRRLGLAPKIKLDSSPVGSNPTLREVPTEANPAQRRRVILTDEMIALSNQNAQGIPEDYPNRSSVEAATSRRGREILPGGMSEEGIRITEERRATEERGRQERLGRSTEFF